MPRPPLRPRSAYRHWNRVSIQWNDNDAYGHVNNAVYYNWFDSTVNGFLIGLKLLDVARSQTIAYVVETSCRYARPVFYPGEVEIGLALARLGTTSVSWHLGVFTAGSADPHAEGSFVHVCVERGSGRPTPVPAEWRTAIPPQTDPQA